MPPLWTVIVPLTSANVKVQVARWLPVELFRRMTIAVVPSFVVEIPSGLQLRPVRPHPEAGSGVTTERR